MKILVVRRDNIGDLVCTTPLIAALRRRHPQAWIGALVNSYNAPVLERNPDVSEVITYTKLKHLGQDGSALAALGARAASLWRLRRMALDTVVLATPGRAERGLTLARLLKPRQIAGFDDGGARTAGLDLRVPLSPLQAAHEVEQVFALAGLFGIEGKPPGLVLVPDPGEVEKARARFASRPVRKVAVHISARRRSQQWPAERFAELVRKLVAGHGVQVMLLWSPGPPDHPQHPGDDDKAAAVVNGTGRDGSVVPRSTARLAELIGALAACDDVICADGGAMHLAAALGKPIVALFGDAPVERWRPWGVRHRIVRPESRDVADLPVADVLAAYAEIAAA